MDDEFTYENGCSVAGGGNVRFKMLRMEAGENSRNGEVQIAVDSGPNSTVLGLHCSFHLKNGVAWVAVILKRRREIDFLLSLRPYLNSQPDELSLLRVAARGLLVMLSTGDSHIVDTRYELVIGSEIFHEMKLSGDTSGSTNDDGDIVLAIAAAVARDFSKPRSRK